RLAVLVAAPAPLVGHVESVAERVPDDARLDAVLERLRRRAVVEGGQHLLADVGTAQGLAEHLIDQLGELAVAHGTSLPRPGRAADRGPSGAVRVPASVTARRVGGHDHNGRVTVDPLARFAAPTRAWFSGAFDAPTAAQAGAWDAVASDRHALVVAPTGSGKTLAAFLWSLDRILSAPAEGTQVAREHRCRVVYVSPLKALAADVERNLRSPLAGIRQAAVRLGQEVPDVVVGTRTGDT